MNLFELFAGSRAHLYHGIKDLSHAVLALENNELLATATQRYWPNGSRLKDNNPKYQTSFWMKGVSMTRDINYAKVWGKCVFVINQIKLAQKYEIIPFNWGFSIPSNNHHKREREEFVVISKTDETYIDPDTSRIDMKRFEEPGGSIKPLSQILEGILVDSEFRDDPRAEKLINHPKFIGFYDFDTVRASYDKSTKLHLK